MAYHDWLVLRALAIFLIACAYLLVGALIESRRRRRDGAVGPDLKGQPVVTPEPGPRNARRGPVVQPEVTARRLRAQHPVTA